MGPTPTRRLALARAGVAVLGIWLLGLTSTVGAKPAAGPTVRVVSGDLAGFVDEFVASMPGRGSGGYDVPSLEETDRMAAAFAQIARGDLAGAAVTAGPLSYEVLRYTDTATGRTIGLLRERPVRGTYRHGWGLYGASSASTSALVVEVAHPVADLQSEDQGVVAFRWGEGARAILVAGTHRDADPDAVADVAHQEGSVFHAIHLQAVVAGTRVYQPHGFGESTDPDHDAVVSNGATPTALTSAVAHALDAAGLRTCLHDGVSSCSRLAATTNVQGAHARRAGAEFLHVETVTAVRLDEARRTRVADIVADLAT